ncbi:hypothetical protein HaLaN_00006 [Haematococcus lacustris]|uniref:Uncharacterized protein n=1 Tax=Haematococcus lacustris TaxID=44745 RepID=A0A699YHW5_HAELA|nr:hypothetical protein HaLaN_00006 [Haematococcus lacustris]
MNSHLERDNRSTGSVSEASSRGSRDSSSSSSGSSSDSSGSSAGACCTQTLRRGNPSTLYLHLSATAAARHSCQSG